MTPAAFRSRERRCVGVVCDRSARARTRACGGLVRPARRVAGLADDADADVGVGAKEKVRREVLEDDVPVAGEAGPRAHASPTSARTCWKVSSSVRTRRTGRPTRSARYATSGSNFGQPLPPNPPPESGATIRTFDSGQLSAAATTRCSTNGCWIGLQIVTPFSSGAAMNDVRLDGEVRDHRELVVVLDDEVRLRVRDVAPAERPFLKRFVSVSGCVGLQRRILDERRARDRAPARRRAPPAALRSPRGRAARPLRRHPRVSAATAATGSPKNFVSPTASTGRSANAGP